MSYTAEEMYSIWLNNVEGIGSARYYRLIAEFGSAQAVWENLNDIRPEVISRITSRAWQNLKAAHDEDALNELLVRMEATGVRAVTTESPDYPAPLLNIYDAPPVLYYKGAAPLHYDRRIGIVGSRRATYDGKRAAREIAEQLSCSDVSVVSGMALGIDTEAHKGALKGTTPTVAVLGCGADIPYPPSNARLYEQILDEGGLILSEYPLGTKPVAGNFPPRNRIISGLCRGVLLVEGAKGSGAMITVDYALDQGKDVFAVPGCIFSPMAEAPNQLIVEGAVPVLGADSILQHYGWTGNPAERTTRASVTLEGDEKRVAEALYNEPLSFDELIMQTGLPAGELNTVLTMLELRQIVERTEGNLYHLNL